MRIILIGFFYVSLVSFGCYYIIHQKPTVADIETARPLSKNHRIVDGDLKTVGWFYRFLRPPALGTLSDFKERYVLNDKGASKPFERDDARYDPDFSTPPTPSPPATPSPDDPLVFQWLPLKGVGLLQAQDADVGTLIKICLIPPEQHCRDGFQVAAVHCPRIGSDDCSAAVWIPQSLQEHIINVTEGSSKNVLTALIY
jgi:hypothetical protein